MRLSVFGSVARGETGSDVDLRSARRRAPVVGPPGARFNAMRGNSTRRYLMPRVQWRACRRSSNASFQRRQDHREKRRGARADRFYNMAPSLKL